MRTVAKSGTLIIALLIAASLRADDWPQWRGPDRTGVSKEKGLLKEWPKEGPTLVYMSKEAGTGYGAPSIVGDTVYILGALDEIENVIALDKTGKKLWAVPIGPKFDFKGNTWINGPNTAPAISGNLLLALGSQGKLVCVDITKKDLKWSKDLYTDLGGFINEVTGGPKGWGYAGSPLIDGDNVIVAPGGPQGTLAALNKSTGDVVWRSKAATDYATYSSVMKAEFEGVPQYVYLAQENVFGVAAKDGEVLWKYERKKVAEEIVAPTPIIYNSQVFISSGDAGCELFDVKKAGGKFEATTVYNNKTIANLHGGMVLIGDSVYGSDKQMWKCVNLKTGKDTWRSRENAPGSIVAGDGMLICFMEGEPNVMLVEASPTKFTKKSEFALPVTSTKRKIGGKLWTHPVIANGNLYLRDQELLYCYKIK